MARSYDQYHPRSHRGGVPRSILGVDEDGNLIERNRKSKPYGRKSFIGNGAEDWERKYGSYTTQRVSKAVERRKNRISIYSAFDLEE